MYLRLILSLLACFSLVLSTHNALGKTEAFEVGPDLVDQLPGGTEADGIIGDFIIRNDKIEAVISCNAVLRKANMGTNWSAVTPGCVYDLTLRGANNDQLTLFAPLGQEGAISYVRIVKDGSDGEAIIETMVTSALHYDISTHHEYRLQDGRNGLLIVTTLKNEGSEAKKIIPKDRITRLAENKTIQEITTADSNDPAAKVGYAFAWVETPEFKQPAAEFELQPGESITMGRVLMIGQSPVEAFGRVARLIKPTGAVQGKLQEPNGGAIFSGKLNIKFGDETLTAYPGENGEFEFYLPVGDYSVTATDSGREAVEVALSISENETQDLTIEMQPASSFVFDIRGEDGASIPCKAQFIGVDGTESPYLGPRVRAHGCYDQYHSETGRFTVQVPPGTYNVVVTRGIEFSHIEKKIELNAGESIAIEGTLRRMVDTSGWVSADFHNHSTPSGDNVCPTHDRVINLAAEHIEFAPTTEHNRIYDWTPYIEDLGLTQELSTIPGIELTGSGAHFNAFPYNPVPRTQDGGAPVWQQDPRLNAIVLRDFQGQNPDRWVQVNHPDMIQNFIDRNGDGMTDGGYKGLENLIDGAETWGPNTFDHNILTKAPYRIYKTSNDEERLYFQRQFIWLQLLNMGHRYWSVAVSDAHSVYGNGVGGWRTYIPSSTDAPAEIDWKEIVRNSKAGQIIVTNGPFLEVETLDGAIAGGSTRAVGSLPVKIKVQCNSWIDIDRVQILVNSRQREDLNFTRETHPDMFSNDVIKFNQTIDVPLSEDSHIIVVAYGEKFTLKTGYGSDWQSKMNPCAYTNPIYVDVDGGGFKPNGDTLDFPLPVKTIPIEVAKKMLERVN